MQQTETERGSDNRKTRILSHHDGLRLEGYAPDHLARVALDIFMPNCEMLGTMQHERMRSETQT